MTSLLGQFWKEHGQKPMVRSVHWGPKISGGDVTHRRAIVVGVDRKLPSENLSKGDRLPRRWRSHPVDVISVGDGVLLNPKSKQELCFDGAQRPGTTIRPKDGKNKQWGTIGLFLKGRLRSGEERHFVLTNAHVAIGLGGLALEKTLNVPGPGECGDHEPFARVVKFTPLDRDRPLTADACLAEVLPGARFRDDNLPFGNADFSAAGLSQPRIYQDIEMWGGASGVRRGVVTQWKVPHVKIEGLEFENFFAVDVPARGGDSGSLVVADDGALGLLVGRSDLGILCSPLKKILSLFSRPSQSVISTQEHRWLSLSLS